MYRVIGCLVLLIIFLNGPANSSPVSDAPNAETEKETLSTTAEGVKDNDKNTADSKEGQTFRQANKDDNTNTSDSPDKAMITNKEATDNIESSSVTTNHKITTRSITSPTVPPPVIDKNTADSKEGQTLRQANKDDNTNTSDSPDKAIITNKEATDNIESSSKTTNHKITTRSITSQTVPPPVIDDIIEKLLNQPTWQFRSDLRRSNNDTMDNDSFAEVPKPGYFAKFTGNMVIPALKARQKFNDSWRTTSAGFGQVRNGLSDAASSAVRFIKDTTSALMHG